MKGAVVIGATSGIGAALSRELVRRGYRVGLAGRRTDRLAALRDELGEGAHIAPMDVRDREGARRALEVLVNEIGDTGLFIVNAGVLHRGAGAPGIEDMIQTNVIGFVTVAEAAMDCFRRRGGGHLVGISSIAAIRGAKGTPVYNASKAFVSTYMDGLRHRAAHEGLAVHVTDIRPGFVETAMIEGRGGLFWVASPEKAARQILGAIERKKKRAYITKRWGLVAFLSRIVPDRIYHKF